MSTPIEIADFWKMLRSTSHVCSPELQRARLTIFATLADLKLVPIEIINDEEFTNLTKLDEEFGHNDTYVLRWDVVVGVFKSQVWITDEGRTQWYFEIHDFEVTTEGSLVRALELFTHLYAMSSVYYTWSVPETTYGE